ncbi:uncharacterized protein LOC105647932 [Jatropha curcas]|uniref:uncharacterized protein LOC105647932 n=1 Tax=Jatropha curcas TaxID=180498 RepID=UPI001893D0F8|nr:uncharacterized protein LOC105647932 [Jatropha curcas]
MIHGHEILGAHPTTINDHNSKKGQRFEKINFGLTQNKSWREKVVRLHLLLITKESAINVPSNLDARRRITFFANSLFMNMPTAPKVRDMLSFSVLTPYYKEDVLYSDDDLHKENEDGITMLFYLKTIYRDEWKNFEERMNDYELNYSAKEKAECLRQWVSYRGQTLARTVRGMMYYKKALEVQCSLEFTGDNASHTKESSETYQFHQKTFLDHAQALADLKFTYVVSCQVYGTQKKSADARDRSCYSNILNLMLTYPSLRVAYIDEREETVNGKSEKVHYSVLVKGCDKLDEEIYRIKLPGPPTEIGEGKPENQNHAIIFTRGEALQTIDMNQDNYFEEAFKMRNVLEEFIKSRRGPRKPTILGLREHIFTGSVSSLAWFMSNQETSFVTIGQRILANPLRIFLTKRIIVEGRESGGLYLLMNKFRLSLGLCWCVYLLLGFIAVWNGYSSIKHLVDTSFSKWGCPERKNRHLFFERLLGVARALLFQIKVPKHFWADAVSTACFLINCMPSSVLNGEIPYNVLFLSKLLFPIEPRIFGCTCDVRPQVSKLDPKSLRYVFLGYSRRHWQFHNSHAPAPIPELVPAPAPAFARPRFEHVYSRRRETLDSLPAPAASTEDPVHSTQPEPVPSTPQSDLDVQDLDLPIRSSKSYDHLSSSSRCFVSNLNSVSIPKTIVQALSHPSWCAAMKEEMAALDSNGTWNLVLLPAATFAWPLHQLDIKKAFLHGDLQEKVYMEQPPGFVAQGESGKVCKLRKSLYGLKQSPQAWFGKFGNVVHQFGMQKSTSDHSVFFRSTKTGLILLVVYVDDIVITRSDSSDITSLKSFLQTQFQTKDLEL